MLLSRRSRFFFSLFLLLCGVAFANAQVNTDLPKVGSVAPPLHLKAILGAPAGTTPGLPRGKVIVLEFWATWCVPCLGEIPVLNTLAKSLDPAKVQFISVTDEDEGKITKFIEKHPIVGWVGLDSGVSFERYGVISRPATIVIDPNGKVISNNISPDRLSGTQLLALAQGKAQTVVATRQGSATSQAEKTLQQAKRQQFSDAGLNDTQNDLFSITLTRATGSSTHVYDSGPQSVQILDGSLEALLTYGLGYPKSRITLQEQSNVEQTYNLSVHAEGAPLDSLKAAVELAIVSGTGERIRHHRAEEDVFLLQRVPEKHAPYASTKPGRALFDEKTSTLLLMNSVPTSIAGTVEDVLSHPVVADVEDAPTCQGTFHVKKGDLSFLKTALETQCGLTLTPGRREIDRITVAK